MNGLRRVGIGGVPKKFPSQPIFHPFTSTL